jgi:cytochrome c biogenesis protein CcmG/thiol:disulfide interchange protein DsbE
MAEPVRTGGLRLWMLLPPLLFFALVGMAWWALERENPDELPSALTAKPAPPLDLAELRPGEAPPTAVDLTAPGVKLVNFWASWCPPCRVEHPVLQALAAEGVTILGVAYKDKPENALAFLSELGDPFAKAGGDPAGRNGIEWGLYGVPETFVVDGSGRILLRYPGPLTPEIVAARIRPLLGP